VVLVSWLRVENNGWRIRYNWELWELYREPCVSVVFKLKRYGDEHDAWVVNA